MKGKLLLFIPLLLGSCSRWIAPPYTNVDKMLSIENGMSAGQVDEALGIKPYNMLHRNEETAIFEYHYRLKDRDVNNISGYNTFIHKEQSQTGGKDWYNKPSSFYILYEDNKVATLLTANGLENSDYLLLKNNNLMLVSQSELVAFDLWEDASYLHKIDNTLKLNADNSGKHNLLYTANIPWAPFGLKYAYMGKFGGYAAFATDFYAIDGTSFISGGFTAKVTPKLNGYVGGGVAIIEGYYDGYYDDYYEESYAGGIIEAGILAQIGRFSLDIGGGLVPDDDYFFGKLGFGINF